jgi:hypothetical protein
VKLLENDRIRVLVAAHLAAQVDTLRAETGLDAFEKAGAVFVADQLADIVTALGGE